MTRLAIITGASRGIGEATAKRLAKRGMSLVLIARDQQNLDRVRELTLANGAAHVDTHAIDVQDESAIKYCFQQLNRQKQIPHILVNCAGIMLDAPLLTTTLNQLQQMLAVNVCGSFLFCQYAARLMVRNRRGIIVNLTSKVGEMGAPGQSAYAASKAAVIGLTKSLAKELGPLGINVNAVSPGFVATDLTTHYGDEQRQLIRERIALRRLGQADDIAAVIDFLCQDQASYINGQILGIDGGMVL